MKRLLLVLFGFLLVPAVAAAQAEIGLDAGFGISIIDDADDNVTSISVPTSSARIGFPAGDQLIVESLLGFDWYSIGDYKATSFDIVPGVNFLVNDQFYVRGEAGLSYSKIDTGTADSSATQYLFGAGAGIRRPLGEGALLRFEAAVDRLLENTDDGVPASWDVRVGVGVSAVVN